MKYKISAKSYIQNNFGLIERERGEKQLQQCVCALDG